MRVSHGLKSDLYQLAEGVPLDPEIRRGFRGKRLYIASASNRLASAAVFSNVPESVMSDFAKIKTADDCLSFAGKYGWLRSYPFRIKTESGLMFGEPVGWWLFEAWLFRMACQLRLKPETAMIAWASEKVSEKDSEGLPVAIFFPSSRRLDTNQEFAARRQYESSQRLPAPGGMVREYLLGEAPNHLDEAQPEHSADLLWRHLGGSPLAVDVLKRDDQVAVNVLLTHLANRWSIDARPVFNLDPKTMKPHESMTLSFASLVSHLWGTLGLWIIGQKDYCECRETDCQRLIPRVRASKQICGPCSVSATNKRNYMRRTAEHAVKQVLGEDQFAAWKEAASADLRKVFNGMTEEEWKERHHRPYTRAIDPPPEG